MAKYTSRTIMSNDHASRSVAANLQVTDPKLSSGTVQALNARNDHSPWHGRAK